MNPIKISIHDHSCYFHPFNEAQDKSQDGVQLYRFSLWGRICAWLGWAIKLKDTNQKVYYVNKKHLDRWIGAHAEFLTIQGNYYQQIADICKNKVMISQFHQGLEICNHIRDRKLREKTEPLIQDFCQKLKDKVALKKAEQANQDALDLDFCVENDLYRIKIGDQVIFAKPERMQTSAYFKYFLAFKEKDQRLIDVHLELKPSEEIIRNSHYNSHTFVTDNIYYQLDNVQYDLNAVEIDEDAFEIFRLYFEGTTDEISTKELVEEDFLDENLDEQSVSLTSESSKDHDLTGEEDIRHLMTPEKIEGLYQIHQLIDISGILEIVYKTIHFYSQELYPWQGQMVSAKEFWNSLAKKYHDTKLKALCDTKYEGFEILEKVADDHQQVLENYSSLLSVNRSHIKAIFNEDGTTSIILNFRNDLLSKIALDQSAAEKILSFLKSLTDQELNKINLSKIFIDLSGLGIYPQGLIKGFDQYLFHSPKTELIFQNGAYLGEASSDPSFSSSIQSLLKKYAQISFENSQTSIISLTNYPSLKQSFKLFALNNVQLETYYKFNDNPRILEFSAVLKPADRASQHVTILNNSDLAFDLESYFDWITPDVSLTIEHLQTQKPWKYGNLEVFRNHHLTIKNMVLNLEFVQELILTEPDLIRLTLENCEIDPECQTFIEQYLDKQMLVEEAILCIEKAIELNDADCLELGSYHAVAMQNCIPECFAEGNNYSLKLNFKFDSWYSNSQFNPKHYKQRLAFILDHLDSQQLKAANLTSVTIDLIQLRDHFQQNIVNFYSYTSHLLRDIQEHFIFEDRSIGLKIEGLPDSFWKDFTHPQTISPQSQWQISCAENLKELLKQYVSISFGNVLPSQTQEVSALFQLLQTGQHDVEIHVMCSDKDNMHFYLSLSPSNQPESKLKFTLRSSQSPSLTFFETLSHPVHFIFDCSDKYGQLSPWTIKDLNPINHVVSKLTIENALIDYSLAYQLNDDTISQFRALTCLTLKNCSVPNHILTHLQSTIDIQNYINKGRRNPIKLIVKL